MSPARSDSAVSSSSGSVMYFISLILLASPFDASVRVAQRVAADVDGDRHPCYVRRLRHDVRVERRDGAAAAGGADAKFVDFAQDFFFKLRVVFYRVADAAGDEQRLFRGERRGLEISADADAYHHRRAGVGAGLAHRFDDGAHDALRAVGWLEHEYAAHVFAAHALRRYRDVYGVAWDYLPVNNGWSVVASVAAVGERVADDRFAQVALAVGAAHSFVDRLFEIAALDVQVLSELDEENRYAAVLAYRHILVCGELRIFYYLVVERLRAAELFRGARFFQRLGHVLGQVHVRGQRELADFVRNLRRRESIYLWHVVPPVTDFLLLYHKIYLNDVVTIDKQSFSVNPLRYIFALICAVCL